MGQLHHCDGLFHKHIDDLFDDSVWDTLLAQERRRCAPALLDHLLWSGSEGRELRLRTTVFADVVNVAQRTTRLPCLQRIPKRKSLGLPLSKTVCFLFSVLNWAECSFLSISISLYFVMQSSCCFLWCLGHRRSCQCTEAVGHPPFTVPSESQAPVVASPQEGPQCSVRDPPWLR